MSVALQKLRKKIDCLDESLLRLLNERARVVLEVGRVKNLQKKEIYVPERENLLLGRLLQKNKKTKGLFPEHAVRAVFGEILSASRSLQSPLKVAYLGPEATFTHLATMKYFGRSTDLVPEGSIAKVFDAVEHKRVVCGVVPIENSTEGIVGATLDCFHQSPLKIMAEVTLPIYHHLLSRATRLKSVKRIYSHPQAIAQCRTWLDENVPNLPLLETDSTARAAERAAEDPEAAGIAGEHAAEIYGLKILKRNLEDNPNNMTRFLVIGQRSPKASGGASVKDKTSLLFSVKDEVGILYRMLEPFYRYKINLSKIESRPLKKKAWEYIFFLDIEGHQEDRKVALAIRDLQTQCQFIKVLGSYPKSAL